MIETLDGEHLPVDLFDAEAYRHDRRMDRLLQQNGFLVFRSLAEDVGMITMAFWLQYSSLWRGAIDINYEHRRSASRYTCS